MGERGTPPPGSPEAIKLGCRCPVLDNAHGAGRGGDGEAFGWWISGDCPVHAMLDRLELAERRIEVLRYGPVDTGCDE